MLEPDPVVEDEVATEVEEDPDRGGAAGRGRLDRRHVRRVLAAWTSSICAAPPASAQGTALRPERFGALAYDFDTRRLSFVRRRSQARGALNEEFEQGLDAPICLTWELTYACNLACVHCLSSSGRRDPRELIDRRVQGGDRRARAHAGLLREHRRRRADGAQGLLGARRVRDGAQGRREVLHQRQPDRRRARALAGGERLRRRADLARRRDRRGQRPRPRRGLLRHRDRRHAAPVRGGDAGLQALRGRDARERRPARRLRGDRRHLRRAAADHAPAAVGARRGRVGRAAPDARASSASSTTGWRRAGRRC